MIYINKAKNIILFLKTIMIQFLASLFFTLFITNHFISKISLEAIKGIEKMQETDVKCWRELSEVLIYF